MHGIELMRRFQDEAIGFGAELIMGKVVKVDKIGNSFSVGLANDETYEAKALILAYGKVPRSLGIEGEDRFMGRGVSTCVTCDAPLFKNRDVAVIGGGNSAIEGSLELATIARKVYLIHRRDAFRADEITVEKIKNASNIDYGNISRLLQLQKYQIAINITYLNNSNIYSIGNNSAPSNSIITLNRLAILRNETRENKNEIVKVKFTLWK